MLNTFFIPVGYLNIFFGKMSIQVLCSFFKRFYLFLERREGREEKRERNTDVWEKHRLVASHTHPDWRLNPQPRHVLWLGIKLATSCFAGQCPTNSVSAIRDLCSFLIGLIIGFCFCYWVVWVLYIFWILIPCQIHNLQIFSPIKLLFIL